MIIKNFEIDKFKKSSSNLHLIYGVNEGIKQDLINNIYLEGYKGDIFKDEVISYIATFFEKKVDLKIILHLIMRGPSKDLPLGRHSLTSNSGSCNL